MTPISAQDARRWIQQFLNIAEQQECEAEENRREAVKTTRSEEKRILEESACLADKFAGEIRKSADVMERELEDCSS